MARSLAQWVDYIQTLHHREIELSLERVREVFLRMYPNGLPYKVISLSGTNGKGSTAELLASIYRQAGYKVGKFTSPHLVHFNERFNLNGDAVDDQGLLNAFDRVETSREDTPITFFEYGTLLAVDLFANYQVDVAIMEIGLGGRLDSVNILDADLAIVTSISIDHTRWLGDTIEEIGFEKVAIARKDRPLVLGLTKPPASMLDYASDLPAQLSQLGRHFDYSYDNGGDTWRWSTSETTLDDLPLPFRQQGVQLSNCSSALEAVRLMSNDLPVDRASICKGISNATILGRCQVLSRKPDIILDVSHNQASVARLSQFLYSLSNNESTTFGGRTIAVCGMLRDKEIVASIDQIADQIDDWHVATIHHDRGSLAVEISSVISSICASTVVEYDRVEDAYDAAVDTLTADDRLVVFGSFHIVGDILEHVN
ncbi:MAG: bifunctional folylpolyglutamate synthase/dihydrofolate synthase [Arenicella sp.]|nr:bifunctional folylpolyglutamate synthase/dihydrofolate synthase [Arenicella sp.]